MFSYLSWYYDNSRILKSVLDSQGIEIDAARTALEETLKQFYVDTADWGLVHWEKELAINPPANATLELRRALINAKLLAPEIMTPERIEAIVNCFVPDKDAKVIARCKTYTFDIYLPSFVPFDSAQEMYKAIYEAKPAHLGVKYQFQSKMSKNLYIANPIHTTVHIITGSKFKVPNMPERTFAGTASHRLIKITTYPEVRTWQKTAQ